MLREIFQGIGQFFEALLSILGLGAFFRNQDALAAGMLRVHIREGGRTITLDLDPAWDVKKIKSVAASKLGLSPDELKIIFAGHELPDDLRVDMCNLGQQSYLYAVKVQVNRKPLVEPSSTPEPEPRRRLSSARTESPVPSSLTTTGFSAVQEPSNDSEPKSSDYFVYCSTCGDIQEGKLRVRCNTCSSGAFCVFEDPESWDDVLIPKRIPGSCENPTCRGDYAQFYFKCASHVTTGEDDSSPPLPLLKRNPDKVPCLACGDGTDLVLIFQCSHVTCVDCFKQYINVRLNDRQFTEDTEVGYTVGCPALCQDSLVKNPHHFKLLGKEQYERYQRFAAEEYVLKSGGVLCPQPDCGMGILPIDVGCNKLACLHGCGYVFCRRCLEGWHLGSCDQGSESEAQRPSASGDGYHVNPDRAAQAKWDDRSKITVRITTKPCPSCRVPTEKSAGCHHMVCTRCQFEWCWLCQVKWGRDCQGNHWFG